MAKDSNPGLLDCEIPKREDQILDGKGSWGVQWSADVTESRQTHNQEKVLRARQRPSGKPGTGHSCRRSSLHQSSGPCGAEHKSLPKALSKLEPWLPLVPTILLADCPVLSLLKGRDSHFTGTWDRLPPRSSQQVVSNGNATVPGSDDGTGMACRWRGGWQQRELTSRRERQGR